MKVLKIRTGFQYECVECGRLLSLTRDGDAVLVVHYDLPNSACSQAHSKAKLPLEAETIELGE